MLIPITHSERVRDAREAAALVRGLGATRVRLTQWHTRAWLLRDRVAILRILAYVEPGSYSTIAFEGITREATLPALAELTTGDAGYIHIAGTDQTLRVWPQRDEAFVDEIAIGRAHAFARFRDSCTDTWINGFVTEPGTDVVACLPRLFGELDQPEVDFDLDLAVDAALALTLEFPDAELEWTAGAIIQFPHGELSAFHIPRIPEDVETQWQDRVSIELGRIRTGA